MIAFVIGCIVFAAGCFAALGLRLAGVGRGTSLAGVLLPLLIASLAGGSYAWYAGPRAAGGEEQSQVEAAGRDGNEMQNLASQLRGKLGAESSPGAAPAGRPAGDLHDLAKKLAEKLERDPGNGQGWALLARSYANIQQFGDAEKAFEKAAKLLPRDALLYADWADARVMAQGRKWDDRAQQLVDQALAVDPKNLKALSLAGIAAQERGDNRKSSAYWSRLKAAAPAGSPEAQQAEASLAETQGKVKGKTSAPSQPSPTIAQAGGASTLSGRIVLDPAVKATGPGATVFVFAKDPKGGGPPLAVKRFSAKELPLAFSLDDADAMVPGRNLSAYTEVQISARLSNSGDALPQAGDIESNVVTARVGSQNIELRLSTARGK